MEDNKITQLEQKVVELTAGEMLRNARTTGRRKREIPTIAKQLCIREEFLQALEDGNYTFIPELVYILGFARNYAMELGLNPDEIVNKIKREMGVISDCQPADGDSDSVSCGISKEKSKFDIKSMVCRAWAFVVRHWIWFASGAAALVVAIVACVLLFIGGGDVDMPVEESVFVTETSSEPAYRVTVRERWGAENSKAATIILQATRGSWIKIEDARGKTEFSRVLVEGDIYYLPTKGKYKATFGDAGGIDIWVDGKLAPKVGDDHVRKSDIELVADKLMSAKADKSEKSEKNDKAEKSDKSDKNEKSDKAKNDASSRLSEYGTEADSESGDTEE